MTSADKKFVFGDAGNCIAFGFGLGLAPKMPGTAGTLAAFPLYWIFLRIARTMGGVCFAFRCGRLSLRAGGCDVKKTRRQRNRAGRNRGILRSFTFNIGGNRMASGGIYFVSHF